MANPFVDEERIEKLLKLLRKPRTTQELLCALNIARRTLYRDFERLGARGVRVSTVDFRRPTRYYVNFA